MEGIKYQVAKLYGLKWRCFLCGSRKRKMTVDHIIPKAQNGKDTLENMVLMCSPCNQLKSGRNPQQMIDYLKKLIGRLETLLPN